MLVKLFLLTIVFDAFFVGHACRYLRTHKFDINYLLGHEITVKSNFTLDSSLWKVYSMFGVEEITFGNNIYRKNSPLLSRFVMVNENTFVILFIENVYKIESINNNTCSRNIYHFTAKPSNEICNEGLPYISSNKTITKRIDCYCPYSTKGKFCENIVNECSTLSLIVPMSLSCMKESKYYVITFCWILVIFGVIIFIVILLRHSKRTTIFLAPFVDDRPFVYHLEHNQRCVYFDSEENELYQKLETIIWEVYKEKGIIYH